MRFAILLLFGKVSISTDLEIKQTGNSCQKFYIKVSLYNIRIRRINVEKNASKIYFPHFSNCFLDSITTKYVLASIFLNQNRKNI